MVQNFVFEGANFIVLKIRVYTLSKVKEIVILCHQRICEEAKSKQKDSVRFLVTVNYLVTRNV